MYLCIMKKEYICKKCGNKKDVKEFYKCNLSLCKGCKKNINKIYREEKKTKDKYTNLYNNNIEILTSKINSIEILINEILKIIKNNDIIFGYIYESIKTIEENNKPNKLEQNLNNIDKTINNINNRNENINKMLDSIFINKKNNFDKDKYENQMKGILEN